MASLIQEEIRGIMVEHGSFYFGSWPQETEDDPLDILETPTAIAAFGSDGIGFFSDCGDEDNTARVRMRFYDRKPEHDTPIESMLGQFDITEYQLAVATLMMSPEYPFRSPYTGGVKVRLYRLPPPVSPEQVERNGELHEVNEDWIVELWPSENLTSVVATGAE